MSDIPDVFNQSSGVEKFPRRDDRYEFFRQLSFLWNGEEGRNHNYMVGEELLTWEEAFGYLDQEKIRTLHRAYSDDPYVETTYVGRQKVKYAPTERGRKKLFKAHHARDPCGDPLESLEHRVGVYLAFAWERAGKRTTAETYVDVGSYTVDVLSLSNTVKRPVEVVTEHNNYQLYRDTYHKLCYFDREYDGAPKIVFSDRHTAYRFFNHLHDQGMIALRNGRFDSDPNISWGQKEIKRSYEHYRDMRVKEWTTITKLWNRGIPYDHDEFLSADW